MRSVLAVIAGYVVFSVLSIAMAITMLGQTSSFTSKLLIFAYIPALAGIAGYITAIFARKAEMYHALALGVIFLLSAVQNIIFDSDKGGILISGVLMFTGAVAGGYLRTRLNYPKRKLV